MMGQAGEPYGYYPTDSNGLSVGTAPPVACVCVIFLQGVCAPILDGGCPGGSCNEMPPVLPPKTPSVPSTPDTQIIDVGFITLDWGLSERKLLWLCRLGGCAGCAYQAGRIAMDECKKAGGKNCDKLGHCVGACVARKCGSIVMSWCLGWIKDPPYFGDPKDREANHAGEQCAVSGGGFLLTCASCCVLWWFRTLFRTLANKP